MARDSESIAPGNRFTTTKSKKKKDTKKGYLHKRGKQGRYYLVYFLNGKRFQTALRDSEGRAVTTKEEAEVARDLLMGPYLAKDAVQKRSLAYSALQDSLENVKEAEAAGRDKLSLAASWDKYLDSQKRPKSGEATLRQYSFQWHKLVEWLTKKPAKATFVREVTPELAEGYVRYLEKVKKLSQGTVNKHIRLCRLVFRILGPAEKMEANPFADIATDTDVQQHRKELSLEKIGEICDAATGEMKTLIFVGLYTGQRLGDCCLLTWEQVDLTRNIINVTPQKTAKRNHDPLIIPIHPAMRPLLEDTPPQKRSGYVLPGLAGLYLESRDKVTDLFQSLLKTCGVKVYREGTGRGDGEKKRAVLQYGFHSLRHSTVSLLAGSGVSMAVVQAIVGHRTVAVTQNYTHVGGRAIQSAIAALPAIGGAAEPDLKRAESIKKVAELVHEADQETLDRVIGMLSEKSGQAGR